MTDPVARVPFDDIYRRAHGDAERIPWAGLGPHPALVEYLDARDEVAPGRALVVACGLGDDAAELAGRDWQVTAFDISPTAIEWCRQRFPNSSADFRVADLLALPEAWRQSFDFVLDVRTIQSIPLSDREHVVAVIASTVAPDGQLLLRCEARGDDEPAVGPPWPVSRAELAGFAAAGMTERSFVDQGNARGARTFTAVYERRMS